MRTLIAILSAIVLSLVSYDSRACKTSDGFVNACTISEAQSTDGNPFAGLYGSGNGSGDGVDGYGGSTGNGVFGSGTGAAGVYGTATGADGVHGVTSDSGSSGASGINTTTGSGGHGVYGKANASGCYGVYGTTQSGYGVYGVASDSGTSTAPGVYGVSDLGNGVKGATGATSTSYAAVRGENSSSGYGVYGASSSGDGVYGTSTSGTGVYASGSTDGLQATCSGSSCNGIYASCTGTSCVAEYVSGELYVAGSFYVNGVCEYGCTSDARLKKNVEPLANALEIITKLNGITYEWKEPSEQDGRPAGRHIGFLAQDVENVEPSWVGQDKQGVKNLNIPPNELAALTVQSVRTLKTENDALKSQVKDQAERIARLEKLAGLDRVSWFERNQTLLLGLGLIGGFAGLSRLRRKREDEKRS